MRYDKLIRDNIPEVLKKKGLIAVTHVASKEEYWTKLREKLQEEAGEFAYDPNVGELADVTEVLDAILDHMGLSWKDVEAAQAKKAEERGRFKERLILEETQEEKST